MDVPRNVIIQTQVGLILQQEARFCPDNTFSGTILCSASNHYRLCSTGLLWGAFFFKGGLLIIVVGDQGLVMRLSSGSAGHSNPPPPPLPSPLCDKSIREVLIGCMMRSEEG